MTKVITDELREPLGKKCVCPAFLLWEEVVHILKITSYSLDHDNINAILLTIKQTYEGGSVAYQRLLIIAGLVLLAGAGVFYWLNGTDRVELGESDTEWVETTITEPAYEPVAPEVVEVVTPEPVLEQPQAPSQVQDDVVVAEEPVVVIPALNNSDDFVRAQIAEFEVGSDLLGLLVSDELIRKFVLFTESVSQGISSRDIPLNAIEGNFSVTRGIDEGHFVMTEETHARFNFLVDTLIAMDTEQAISFYNLLSPLFEQAYAEIGYRDRVFDKVMLAAIDKVLSATVIEEPIQLIRPSVVYMYAEEEVEMLTPVERLLLRLGPDNADELKQKLRAFRYSYMTQAR